MTEIDPASGGEALPIATDITREIVEAALVENDEVEFWLEQIDSDRQNKEAAAERLTATVDAIFVAFDISPSQWADRFIGFEASYGGPLMGYGARVAQDGGISAGHI